MRRIDRVADHTDPYPDGVSVIYEEGPYRVWGFERFRDPNVVEDDKLRALMWLSGEEMFEGRRDLGEGDVLLVQKFGLPVLLCFGRGLDQYQALRGVSYHVTSLEQIEEGVLDALFLAKAKLAGMTDDVDWRPNETIPEDFYAL